MSKAYCLLEILIHHFGISLTWDRQLRRAFNLKSPISVQLTRSPQTLHEEKSYTVGYTLRIDFWNFSVREL